MHAEIRYRICVILTKLNCDFVKKVSFTKQYEVHENEDFIGWVTRETCTIWDYESYNEMELDNHLAKLLRREIARLIKIWNLIK